MARARRLHDLAYASTWGWYLPDWPHYRRPLLKDPWFVVFMLLAIGTGIALVGQGQYVAAAFALFVLPFGGGGSRRLLAGIDERDKAYRIREKLAQRNGA
jgi:hypothetical protein